MNRWVGVAVAVLLAAGAVWYLVRPPHQTRDVAVPRADASPDQVVRDYLDALNAHDCRTAEAVVARSMRSRTGTWCSDLAHLTHIDIGSTVQDNPRDSGFPSGADVEVVSVPVEFDLDWRPFHGDPTMPQGRTAWGYELIRGSPSQPWRIFDQGFG